MAKRDVREYYGQLIIDKLQLQEDLKDFTEAFEHNLITEDKLQSVKDEIECMNQNIERVAWILYLLDLPNRRDKNTKYLENDPETLKLFDSVGASTKAVRDEHACFRTHIKEYLKELTNKTDK